MDTFMEHLVQKQIKPIQWVLYAMIVLFAILIVIMTISIPFVGSLIFIAACYGSYFLYKRNFIEYEYIYTNGEMDIDRIIGKSKRKRMLSFHTGELELMAAMGDENFRSNFEGTNFQKKFDYSSGNPNLLRYFAIINKKDIGRILLVFEPEERMVSAMHILAVKKVHLS